MSNRTTVKSNIVTKNVPTVTNAILTDMLNAELADNLRFREDVAVAQTSAVSNITCDFTNKDRINLTRTGGELNISVSGIGDGEEKFLLITKTTGQMVYWNSVTDITPAEDNIKTASTLIYQIIRKGSVYIAQALIKSPLLGTDAIPGILRRASVAEHNALAQLGAACVPGRLPLSSETQTGLSKQATLAQVVAGTDVDGGKPLHAAPSSVKSRVDAAIAAISSQGNWVDITPMNNWTGVLRYFVDQAGFMHLHGNIVNSGNVSAHLSSKISNLPYSPSYEIDEAVHSSNNHDGYSNQHYLRINGTGLTIVCTNAYSAGNVINFYKIFRIDA